VIAHGFPGIWDLLWKGNVLHGLRLQNCVQENTRRPEPADCSDACLKLVELGVLSPIAFRPNHSQAAFLGLDGCKSGEAPTPRDAHAWDYQVLAEDAFVEKCRLLSVSEVFPRG